MMKDDNDPLMGDALRLTQAGRLAEATALIQRRLGGVRIPPGSKAEQAGESKRMDAMFQVGADPAKSIGAPPSSVEARPRTFARAVHPGLLPGRAGIRAARRHVAAEAVAPAVGRWIDGTCTDAAGTRAYKLYVPSGYQGKPLPLVVMLHGCTQYPDDFAAGTAMNFRAEEDGFFVVYPAQAETANASKCWNWFQAADQRRDQGEPALIAAITRQVIGEYQLDAGRVYVAGLSAGGAMAAIMAATYPDLYAAVGVHSGLAPGSAHDLPSAFQAMKHGAPATIPGAGQAVPLILFHGDRDPTVHPCNADHLVRHWNAVGMGTSAVLAPTVTARPGQKAGERDATCAIHRTARRRILVEHWTVHGAGHAWSGGTSNGSHTDPNGPDASREMVRFFHEHPAPKR